MKPQDVKAKRREAFRLVNDLTHDIITGLAVGNAMWDRFNKRTMPVLQASRVAVKRMTLFHTILTLAKWVEFYDRYKSVIPASVRHIAKTLRNEIQRRGIVRFRNSVVGHIWHDEHKRALTTDEIEQHLHALPGGSFGGFMTWAADLADVSTGRPVPVIEAVRDAFMTDYGLTNRTYFLKPRD